MEKRKMTAEDASKMFPVGQEVKYYPTLGEDNHVSTKIRSEAWALGHGGLVIKIEGMTGGVCVSHLELV